jgi:radical SAM protein with 4Fe4S-binding SPASM domain
VYRIHPNLKWRWEKDRLLLSNLVSLNENGGLILESFAQPQSVEVVVDEQCQRYPDVDREKIRTDVVTLVTQLVTLGVLYDTDKKSSPPMGFPPNYTRRVKKYFNNQLSAPISAALDVTFSCNAACKHCSVKASDTWEGKELTTEQWMHIIDQLVETNVFTVSFTGGEPLLRKDVETLIAYANKKGLHTLLVSNGYLLDEARAQSLAASGLKTVYISVDGCCAETHDEFRQLPGSFDRALNAMTLLTHYSIPVAALTTLNNYNCKEIEDLMHLVNSLGIRRHDLMVPMEVGRVTEYPQLRLSIEDYLWLLPCIHRAAQSHGETFYIYPNAPAYCYAKTIGLTAYKTLQERGQISNCIAGTTLTFITPDGYLKPCDASGNTHLESVLRTPLHKIWTESPELNRIRTATKAHYEPCRQCDLHHVCSAGCKALESQLTAEGPFVADILCHECFAYFHNER